jgi:class 3 adenylate cyclase
VVLGVPVHPAAHSYRTRPPENINRGAGVWRDGVPAGRAAAWPAFYAVGVETLTFLFTDIEGSTALLRRLGKIVMRRCWRVIAR